MPKEKSNIPRPKIFVDAEKGGFFVNYNSKVFTAMHFHGDFDGGDIAMPTEPVEYLDTPFDGGVIGGV